MRRMILFALAALVCAPAIAAPQESDAYTRYELLAPGSGKFRILYDVTASRPGATAYFNPIRKGSIASDEAVFDAASGKPLEFHQVSGVQAREDGLKDADATMDYIKVTLARPVPSIEGGGGRIRIDKTYEDKKSYAQDGGDILFSRPLGIKKNAVVLPANYALTSCNYPSQIEQEADGRLKISFFNVTPAEAPLLLRAHPIGPLSGAGQSSAITMIERAAQTRDIVYFLRDPDSHSFDLYHDYTETRIGMDHYLNVVRTGSWAANPSAVNLDSGEALSAQHLRGAEITAAGIRDEDLGQVSAESEVVLFRFAPLAAGQSVRLRMSETYQDAKSYRRQGDELVFERSLGRAINAVVLPAGWILTNSAVPATVSATEDGRVRLDFLNPRNDEVKVQITARRLSTK
jgi:hypothetical protein